MGSTLGKAGCSKRPEIFDVVGHDGASFTGRDLENLRIASADQIKTVDHRYDVVTGSSEQRCDLRGELFV